MMLFQNGKMLWRQSGVVSKNEIVTIVKQKVYDIKK
jgi:thioredoxin 1